MRRLTALLSLLLAAPAPAAEWSAPREVPASADASSPRLAFSPDGTAFAAWTAFDGASPSLVSASRPTGAEGFSPGAVLAERRGALVDPVAYGGSRVAVAFTDPAQRHLEVVLGPARGSFPAARVIASGRRLARPALATNLRGDIAVAWFDDRGTHDDRVMVAIRRAGARFSRPLQLARERVRGVSVAVGARGDVLVAWDARGTVRTRLRDPRGRRFHRTETIRSQDAFFARLRTALTPTGRAVVAWSAQLRSEGGDSGAAFHQAAVRPAGARRFRTAQLLERHDRLLQQDAGIELALDGRGQPLLAWSGPDRGRWRVRVAESDARGRFTITRTVSPAGVDAVLRALAAGPRGEAAVLWDAPDFPGDNRIWAATRPGPGGFDSPATVSQRSAVSRPRVAFDPVSARATAVWEQRGGSAGPQTVHVMTATQVRR